MTDRETIWCDIFIYPFGMKDISFWYDRQMSFGMGMTDKEALWHDRHKYPFAMTQRYPFGMIVMMAILVEQM